MLDRDTLLIRRMSFDFDDGRSDFHECLDRVKDMFEDEDEVKKNFLESVDRYLKTVKSDR